MSILLVKKNECINERRAKLLFNANVVQDKLSVATLKKLIKKTTNGFAITEYGFGKKDESPRLYAKTASLQRLPNDVVNFIAPHYVDIDMVNCSFTILRYLADKTGIVSSELNDFVDNRDDRLKQFGLVKQDVMKIMFYQKIRNGSIVPQPLVAIHKTIYEDLIPKLMNEFDQLYNAENDKGNPQGSFLTKVVFTLENTILMQVDEFLRSRSFKPEVLKFDGLLVREDERLNDELLSEISEHVLETTGIRMNFLFKPTETKYNEEDLLPNPSELPEIPQDTNELLEKVATHATNTPIDHINIAKLFMLISPFTVLKDIGGQCWSLAKDNFWVFANPKDEGDLHLRIYEDIFAFSQKWKDYYLINYPDLADYFTNTLKKLGSRSWRRSVQADVICSTAPIDNAVQMLMHNAHLVAFSDGVYDLIEGEFRKVKPEDFVQRGTGYKFPTESNPDIRRLIKDFYSSILPSDEMVRFRLLTVASSLFGRHVVEIFLCLKGFGRNGKGVEDKLIQNAFGGYYYPLEKQNLMSSTDTADKPNSQMYAAAFKRYISVKEPAENEKFKADTMKWMTANDPHTVRKPHDSTSLTFPIAGMVTVQTNHPFKFDRMDGALTERSKIIEYPYQFVAEPIRENDKLIDLRLKEYFERPSFRDEFMLLLIDTFRTEFVREGEVVINFEYPPEVMKFTIENLVKSLDGKDWFDSEFVATNTDDRVKRSDLWISFKNYHDSFSLNGTKIKQSDFFRDLEKVFPLKIFQGQYYFVGLREKSTEEKEAEQ